MIVENQVSFFCSVRIEHFLVCLNSRSYTLIPAGGERREDHENKSEVINAGTSD